MFARVAKVGLSCRDKCCHVTVVVMDDIDDATTKKLISAVVIHKIL